MDLLDDCTELAGVPARIVLVDKPEIAAKRGTLLVFHGLTASASETAEVMDFAERGFLVIAVDAVGHGQRRFPDFDERVAPDRAEATFFDIVRRTADEVPEVVRALHRHGWICPGRLGGFGTSMGGSILFGTVRSSMKLDAAVAVVASPRWVDADDSPHRLPHRFYPTPWLMITAGADTVVPPADARRLHASLLPQYAAVSDRVRYTELANEEHIMQLEAWNRVVNDAHEWFDRWFGQHSGVI